MTNSKVRNSDSAYMISLCVIWYIKLFSFLDQTPQTKLEIGNISTILTYSKPILYINHWVHVQFIQYESTHSNITAIIQQN